MTPGARVSAAIAVLDDILAGAPAEQALTRWGRGNRYAGSKDRRAVRDHVYEALRHRASFARLGAGLTGRGLMLGSLRHAGTPPETIFTGEGYAPPVLSAEEAAFIPATASEEETLDWPGWLIPETRAALGAETDQICQIMRKRAPVWLRVNPRRGSRDAAIASLRAEGITAEPSEKIDTALLLTENERKLATSAAYQQGLVELQDLSSQLAVAALPLQPGMRVLDYCAGGGGKALAMAATDGVRVFAHDADAKRMQDIPNRAKRAGAEITILPQGDITGAPFDLVLIDAPCSGSGTWRRTPDMKWKLTPERLQQFCALQADILDKAEGLVSENGTLAYATCSFLACENEDQITAFTGRHPGWKQVYSSRHTPLDGGDGFGLTLLTRASQT